MKKRKKSVLLKTFYTFFATLIVCITQWPAVTVNCNYCDALLKNSRRRRLLQYYELVNWYINSRNYTTHTKKRGNFVRFFIISKRRLFRGTPERRTTTNHTRYLLIQKHFFFYSANIWLFYVIIRYLYIQYRIIIKHVSRAKLKIINNAYGYRL